MPTTTPTPTKKYRLVPMRRLAPEPGHYWELRHPDGYWVGPELGLFETAGEALDWLHNHLRGMRRA
jgi:hypothetical protein